MAWVKICFDTWSPETYDYALMSAALPSTVDLAHAVRRGFRISGRLPISSLPRLAASLATQNGEADIVLEAAQDAERRVVLSGRIEAVLELLCQRCLRPVEIAVHAEPKLAWVKSDAESAELREDYEPLLAPDGRVTLADIVTDELLLALPLVPRHGDDTVCGKPVQQAEQSAAPEEDRKRPFAELAKLKRGR